MSSGNPTPEIPGFFSPRAVRFVEVEPLGRASSVFFQGLLDGHPEVIALPFDATPLQQVDSHERSEPHATADALWLGVQRACEEYGADAGALDEEAFREIARAYLEEHGVDLGTQLVATFLGYGFASGRDLAAVRYLCVSGHGYASLLELLRRFHGVRVVFTLRDPRASYASMKKRSDLNPLHLHIDFDAVHRVVHGWLAADERRPVVLFRHEDIHSDYPSVRRRLLDFLEIADHPALDGSSFFGVPYTGEGKRFRSTEALFVSRPDPAYVHDRWRGALTAGELEMVQATSRELMAAHGYDPIAESALTASPDPFDYPRFITPRLRWRPALALARALMHWKPGAALVERLYLRFAPAARRREIEASLARRIAAVEHA